MIGALNGWFFQLCLDKNMYIQNKIANGDMSKWLGILVFNVFASEAIHVALSPTCIYD